MVADPKRKKNVQIKGNSMSATDADRRRIRMLSVGGGLYFLILLNGLRYFGHLPSQIVILGAALNGMIFTVFVVTIRKVHKRMRAEEKSITPTATPTVTTEAKPRNVRALWLAASLYFMAMLIASQYATKVPYQVLVLGGILNMAIVLFFVVKLRKAYMRIGSGSDL
jgi:hypothetical protein